MRWHDMTPETALLTIAAVQLVLLGGFVALGLVVRNALLGLREAADRMALEARCVPPALFMAADGGPLPGAGPMRNDAINNAGTYAWDRTTGYRRMVDAASRPKPRRPKNKTGSA